MKRKRLWYGIRQRYLLTMVALLVVTLLAASTSVWLYLRTNIRGAVLESYQFMTERMGITLDSLYEKTDEVTAECILDDAVQKSLLTAGLSEVERSSLSKYFAYLDLDYVEEYCYVDNQEHIYVWSYSKVTYEDFEASGLADRLGEDYAKTQWIWMPDTLSGSGEEALFVGRYVRSLEYAHDPGMLFFKMSPEFLGEVIDEDDELLEDVFAGVVNADGALLTSHFPEGEEAGEADAEAAREQIFSLAETADDAAVRMAETADGILLVYPAQADLAVFTFVPNAVLIGNLSTIYTVFLVIWILIAVAAVLVVLYLSKRLTQPIAVISETMNRFDGDDFHNTIDVHTNTELDEIGRSYNGMLETMERQVMEIHEQEKALRTAELDMLIAQINPHFLYNTLDNIYMLARMDGEETTMQMIQALSRYLHVCLSKGSDMVTVADELENVRSYMEIRQIRNENLFTYEIVCELDDPNQRVLKLILQPLVENALRHGFADIFEGGVIRIRVREEDDLLVFSVYNSGAPIPPETLSLLNGLATLPLGEMQACFPDREHGYGVVNIVTRLRLQYGDDIAFYYESDESGTTCTIRVPRERGGDG